MSRTHLGFPHIEQLGLPPGKVLEPRPVCDFSARLQSGTPSTRTMPIEAFSHLRSNVREVESLVHACTSISSPCHRRQTDHSARGLSTTRCALPTHLSPLGVCCRHLDRPSGPSAEAPKAHHVTAIVARADVVGQFGPEQLVDREVLLEGRSRAITARCRRLTRRWRWRRRRVRRRGRCCRRRERRDWASRAERGRGRRGRRRGDCRRGHGGRAGWRVVTGRSGRPSQRCGCQVLSSLRASDGIGEAALAHPRGMLLRAIVGLRTVSEVRRSGRARTVT